MTNIMNEITCSLCTLRNDEVKWIEHLVSTNHSQLCENKKDKIALKFFEMIFSTYSKIGDLYKLKTGKTHDFWQSYFPTKLPKKNFVILCSESINISELEESLISDLLIFTKDATHDIGGPSLNHWIK